MELINSMSLEERVKLHQLFYTTTGTTADLEDYLSEKRFSDGRVCPICGGTHVQRNGRRSNGAQTNPAGAANGSGHVIRSGAWLSTSNCCRV